MPSLSSLGGASSSLVPRPNSSSGGNNSSNSEQQTRTIHFLQALTSISVPPPLLQGGVPVQQVAANGKTEPATLTLSHDKFTVTLSSAWGDDARGGGGGNTSRIQTTTTTTKLGGGGFFSSSKNQQTVLHRAIDIGEMDRILRGQSTQHFERAKKAVNANAAIKKADLFRNTSAGSRHLLQLDPDRSFSIIFRGTDTLDLMIGHDSNTTSKAVEYHKAARNELCSTLDSILQAYQHAKVRVAPDVLLLRHVWLHVVVDRTNAATAKNVSMSPASLVQARKQAPAPPAASSSSPNGNNSDNNNNNRQNSSVSNVVYYTTAAHWQKILPAINFFMKPKDVQSAYDHFGKVIHLDRTARRRGLTFEQSATFLHKIKRDSWMVKPVQVIWEELFGNVMNNGKLRTTVSEKTFLEKFWHGCQEEHKATLVDVRRLFRRLHDMEIAHDTTATRGGAGGGALPTHRRLVGGVDPSRITRDQFEAYLLGAENDAFDPSKDVLDMSDMNQPLSEYWINSSHNTYLIGDQYLSHSNVEMYSNALYRGCRCLELDIWDGGKAPGTGTPKPVVWHGHTLTSKIPFDEIIKTIKVFLNFHHDAFPIILSFENHCSIPYQEVMAEQLVRILGDSLYIPTEKSLTGPLPSPNQLRGMVVIKGRRPDGTEVEPYDTDDDLSDDEGGSSSSAGPTSSMGDSTVAAVQAAQRQKLRKKHGVAPQLARLTLFHGHKLKTFEESIRTPSYYMHSFSENKVRSHCRHKQSYRWIVHNQSHMSRTYPAGARVDSSNYNPLLAWSVGCQMVALNFQTEDAFLRLNDGRFRENGQCGYVLKPESLMMKNKKKKKDDDDYSSSSLHTITKVAPLRLTVQVLSGSCLPKPRGQRVGDCIDPYVKVQVFDVVNEEKETISTHQTDAVPQNGFFPIWHQGKFQFKVENWAVAMMQVTVYDKAKEEFIASSSIPISCLRRGIRSVKLYDQGHTRTGAFDFASLLLKIKMEQVLAEI